jgi:transcription elongation factor GreA
VEEQTQLPACQLPQQLLQALGEKKVWQIVGEPEADVKSGKVSVTSPVARASIGKTKGAIVEVEAPGGSKAYKIRQVLWAEDSRRS